MAEDAFQNLRQVTLLLPHRLTSAKIKPAVILGVSRWSRWGGGEVNTSEQSRWSRWFWSEAGHWDKCVCGGGGGRQRAGHVLVTVEQRGPADRWAGEPPCYTSDDNTAHKRDRSTCRHTRTGNGNSTPGSLWPCGWDGSHDSTPAKLSCLPL